MNFVIAASHPGYEKMAQELNEQTEHNFLYISEKSKLNIAFLKDHKIQKVFLPHWSFIVPEEVFESVDCIIFHMTDLPFGRGGSPLQNLIVRGITETKISALKCVADIDAGPIYLKRELSLAGTAREILDRAIPIIIDMIKIIVLSSPQPTEQKGEPTFFQRRQPHQGDLSELDSLEKVYDFIRMLDADGYPSAFLETKHFRFEFQKAVRKAGEITAEVLIKTISKT